MKNMIASRFRLVILVSISTLFFNPRSQAQEQDRPKLGLVLSGGGARGVAHIGIIKAMEEAGLRPDYIAGTSMGSIIAALYAVGYSADQMEEIGGDGNEIKAGDQAAELTNDRNLDLILDIPLKVSAPFHSSLMAPASDRMEKVLGDTQFSEASFPIIQNVDAIAQIEGDTIRDNLVKQVQGAVLWTQCVDTMKNQGAKNFIECGPGKVLAGLLKKIDSDNLKTLNTNSLEELKAVESALKDV